MSRFMLALNEIRRNKRNHGKTNNISSNMVVSESSYKMFFSCNLNFSKGWSMDCLLRVKITCCSFDSCSDMGFIKISNEL